MTPQHDEMMDLVLRTPELLRLGAAAPTVDVAPADDVVMLGMGGSGMAARAAALGGTSSQCAVHVHQGYGLPPWAVARNAMVVAVSYSGNTEEVLSGVQIAIEAGLPVVAVSSGGRLADIAAASPAPHIEVPGGMQPRAALGSLASAALWALQAAGATDAAGASIEEAADVVEAVLGGGNGAGFTLGADIAEALEARIPLIVGPAGPASLAARRWVTQINENAKRLAMAVELPEANHNAMEAWAAGTNQPGPFGFVALHDRGFDRRTERRLELSIGMLAGVLTMTGEAIAAGTGPLARFMSLAVIGDVASVVMAERAGVEATPVESLENFKRILREEPT